LVELTTDANIPEPIDGEEGAGIAQLVELTADANIPELKTTMTVPG